MLPVLLTAAATTDVTLYIWLILPHLRRRPWWTFVRPSEIDAI